MAIGDRTRKILWGKAAGRCAFCKRSLVEEGKQPDAESVVGDECHNRLSDYSAPTITSLASDNIRSLPSIRWNSNISLGTIDRLVSFEDKLIAE
jgi:hypothetical protein